VLEELALHVLDDRHRDVLRVLLVHQDLRAREHLLRVREVLLVLVQHDAVLEVRLLGLIRRLRLALRLLLLLLLLA